VTRDIVKQRTQRAGMRSKGAAAFLLTHMCVYTICSIFIYARLFNRETALKWYSVLWFEHTDHWHAFNIAKHLIDGGVSLSIQNDVYSRLPSFVPDVGIAVVTLLSGANGLLAMKAYVMIKIFLLYVIGWLIFERGRIDRCEPGHVKTSIVLWGIALVVIGSLNSEFLYTFVPIHHGGNVLITLVATLIVIRRRQQNRFWTRVFETVVPFVGVLSNRMLIPSIIVPMMFCCLLQRQRMAAARWASGSILAIYVLGGLRTQGRDSIQSINTDWFREVVKTFASPDLLWIGLSIILLIAISIALSKKGLERYESCIVMRLSALSGGIGVVASYMISSQLQMRYILPSMWLMLISYCILSMEVLRRLKRPLMVLSASALLLVAITYSSLREVRNNEMTILSEEMNEVLQLLGRETLEGDYGLAAYPSWHASAIWWISKGRFRVLEASSDSNPLFWHRWKGSYLIQERQTETLNSPKINEILGFRYILTDGNTLGIIERYGEPLSRECIRSNRLKCLWRYSSGKGIMQNTRIFIKTYGDKVKS